MTQRRSALSRTSENTARRRDGADKPVYSQIRQMIKEWQLGIGRRIYPDIIAKQLFVSSTPVREALIRLSAQNLIDEIQQAGFFTKTLSERQFREQYRVSGLTLEWSINQLMDYGPSNRVLKPDSVFGVNKPLAPDQAVETLHALYKHLIAQSDSDIVSDLMRTILTQTYIVDLAECEASSMACQEIGVLSNLYFERNFEDLLSSVRRFHQNKLDCLPTVLRTLKQSDTFISSTMSNGYL